METRRGNGSRPHDLLSHGWNADAGHLAAFVAPLLGKGFSVVAFDHLGHGASEGSRSNVRAFRDGLLAVAGACQRDGRLAGLIAHSVGATTAVLALEQGLAPLLAPGAPVALLAPPLDPVRYAFVPFAEALRLSPARHAAVLQRVQDETLRDCRLAPAELIRVACRQTRPALIVHDSDDRPVPRGDGEALAAAWTGSRFHPTSGLGHRRILTDPAVVAAVVRFFADATSGSSSSR